MSFDLNLNTACNHEIFRELSLIDSTRHILRLDKPLAVTASLSVYATDNLIPASMYTIIDDPQHNGNKVISFKQKWKSPTDYFETTYYTIAQYCPKCVNTNYLDDITYDVRGDLIENRDETLLLQNAEKFTITNMGSNVFYTFIGTSLVSLIGSKVSNPSFMISQITSEISRAFQKFKDIQSQYQLTGRAMTPGETLKTVNNIQVTQDLNDPTIMRAQVDLEAVSGKTVTYVQYLKIS